MTRIRFPICFIFLILFVGFLIFVLSSYFCFAANVTISYKLTATYSELGPFDHGSVYDAVYRPVNLSTEIHLNSAWICLRVVGKIRLDILPHVRRTASRIVSAGHSLYRLLRIRQRRIAGRRRGRDDVVDCSPELPLWRQRRTHLVQLHLLQQPRRQLLVEELEERLAEPTLLPQHLHLGDRLGVDQDFDGVPDSLKDGTVVNAYGKTEPFWVVGTDWAR